MRTSALISILLLAGCAPGPPEPIELPEVAPDERDEAITLLERSGTDLLDASFQALDRRSHTLREHLHQLDEAGRISAFRRRTIVHEPPETETVSSESEGTFDFGAFGRFVSFDDLDRLPQNPVPFLLAEDPPFLTPRGRDVYHFAFEPDTTLGGVRVRVVAVTAIPREADDQPLRWARLFIEPGAEQIVGISLRRHSQNVLFGETSLLEVMLAPRPDGTWLPQRSDYRVALRAALTATRRFQLLREYGVGREEWSRRIG
jgi:hypothetical protein